MVSGVFSVVVLVWLDVKDGRGGVTGGGEPGFESGLSHTENSVESVGI